MLELLITQGVYKTIKDDCYANPSTETGGKVLGTLRRYIAISATTAGDKAVKTLTSFINDENYDKKIFNDMIVKYNGRLKSIGYWHKHPSGLSHPSYGDLTEARKIMKEINREGDKRPFFFLIAIIETVFKLYGYVPNQNMTAFEDVKISLIEDDADEIREALAAEPVIIQPQDLDFWRDSSFQWYRTKCGQSRLKEEIIELEKKNYRVKAFAGAMLCLSIEKDGKVITCVTPPEYPLNPPRLFENNEEVSPILKNWNSSFMIIDILTQSEKDIVPERRIHEDHHTQANHLSGVFGPIKKTLKSIWPFTRR
jgi:hypothetical protein